MQILIAAAVMTALGLFFGIVLAVARSVFRVEEDPRLEQLEAMLPGTNCGACGVPGCHAFANKILAGDDAPSGCTVSGADALQAIADFLGVDVGTQTKIVARLHCAGGLGPARRVAAYEGFGTCRASHIVAGGGKGCSWGCLGLADCEVACGFGAISMNSEQLPVVDIDKCTACNDCVEVCPRDLFDLMPVDQPLIVQCAIPLAGEDATSLCSVACDACGRCAADAAPQLIRMVNNLPVLDYENALGAAAPNAVFRCPTGAIQWIENQQFDQATTADLTWARHE